MQVKYNSRKLNRTMFETLNNMPLNLVARPNGENMENSAAETEGADAS